MKLKALNALISSNSQDSEKETANADKRNGSNAAHSAPNAELRELTLCRINGIKVSSAP